MTESTTPKQKFDDWSELKECSNCQRWWNDQCDGTPQGSVRPCMDFLATRSVKIPEEIETLRKQIKWLTIAGMLIVISQILHTIGVLLQ
jgi:hypothetical protein